MNATLARVAANRPMRVKTTEMKSGGNDNWVSVMMTSGLGRARREAIEIV
jgi:hypothetical protein